MYKVAVIGAGQLGSRHLQGLKSAALPLSIIVVDNSEASLKIAQERYNSIPAIGEKEVNYTSDLGKLPKELDLVIVATGSKPRRSIITSLLGHAKVKYLVLEKVLFSSLEDYDEMTKILKQKHVQCWVNCPRRMFGMYMQIKEMMNPSMPLYMTKADENWGLCCNAIHMIDIFMYLTGEKIYSIDTKWVNNEIENSKRGGYIEMTGMLKISTPNGNELTLVSENNFKGEKNFLIENGDDLYTISEGLGFKFHNQQYTFPMPYQSQLTGLLADEILITGGCTLTPFELSVSYHKPFIESMLAKYNAIMGTPDNKLLPIT